MRYPTLIALALFAAGSAPAQPPEVVPGAVRTIDELRVPTDRTIVDSAGDTVKYYEKRKPAKGNTFLDVHLLVSAPYDMELSRSEVRLAPTGDAEGYRPFDLYLDEGLTETRGDTLHLGTGAEIHFTAEVPADRTADLEIYLWNRRVASVADLLPEDERRTSAPVTLYRVTATRRTEHRMKTGAMVQRDGMSQPVYEKRTPPAGSVFLEIEAQVEVDGYREIRRSDLSVVGAVGGRDLTVHPFDWYLEKGLEEVRAEPVTLYNQGILTMLFQVPESAMSGMRLVIAGADAGRVGDLTGK